MTKNPLVEKLKTEECKVIPTLQYSSTLEDVKPLRQYFSERTITMEDFKIFNTLGTGSFGRVKLGSYIMNNKENYCALKIMKKHEIIRLKQVEHVKSELDVLARINNPFIVNLYHYFQNTNYIVMVMQYIPGGELFSHLRKMGRFSNIQARFYAAELVHALEYLHEQNIAYRDLKPENLLIDHEGHLKITDFGFAKVIDKQTTTICGTPEYLAPETIKSIGHGCGVDWWALGVLIFEMLAGYPPYFDENPFGIYQKIISGKVEYPDHFHPNAIDLISKLLVDKSKRLGNLKGGVEDIKTHPWFKREKVTDKEIGVSEIDITCHLC